MLNLIHSIRGTYALDSPWRIGDSNQFQAFSEEVGTVWDTGHRADGLINDVCVPVEAAIVSFTAGAYVFTKQTPSFTAVVKAAVGKVHFTLDGAHPMDSVDYAVMAWPHAPPTPNHAAFCFDSTSFAKSTTDFEVCIVDETGAFQDLSILVLVFGKRGY